MVKIAKNKVKCKCGKLKWPESKECRECFTKLKNRSVKKWWKK